MLRRNKIARCFLLSTGAVLPYFKVIYSASLLLKKSTVVIVNESNAFVRLRQNIKCLVSDYPSVVVTNNA